MTTDTSADVHQRDFKFCRVKFFFLLLGDNFVTETWSTNGAESIMLIIKSHKSAHSHEKLRKLRKFLLAWDLEHLHK